MTVVGFVDGAIPFVVTTTPFLDWRCRIPVLPNGGGEDQPLERRTSRCGHWTRYLIGRAPTCSHHIRYAVRELTHLDARRLPPMDECIA